MEETITYHTCSKCGEEKPLTTEYFCRRKGSKSGFMGTCKVCNYERGEKYREENREKELERGKKYREENPELVKQSKKNYSEKNKEKELDRKRIYYYNNKEKFYFWVKERMKNNPMFRHIRSVRNVISLSFLRKGWSKDSKTQEYLGCDWETFMEHIENQFVDGMSWDNEGEWHYDHYYPVSLSQTKEDMYIFNHYTNFQPLWAKDNLSKSNKVPDGFEEWYEMMKEKVFNNVLVV
jgi:hypothetical protein